MDDNTASPFHRSFLLRAAICVALMALVFAAGTLLVDDKGQRPQTATSEALPLGSRPRSTLPREARDDLVPSSAPNSIGTALPDIDELAEPLHDLAEGAMAAPPGGEGAEPPDEIEGLSPITSLSGPRDGFSLSVPRQWTTAQEPGSDVALLAAPDRGDGLPVEVLVTWQDLAGQTVKETADAGRAALAAGLGDFEEQAFEEKTLAGREAYRLHATYLADDGTGREVETWWVAGAEGQIYVLNASRSDVGDAKDWGDARAVIASLTLRPA